MIENLGKSIETGTEYGTIKAQEAIKIGFDNSINSSERFGKSKFPEEMVGEGHSLAIKTLDKKGNDVEGTLSIEGGKAYMTLGQMKKLIESNGENVTSIGFTKTDFVMEGEYTKQSSTKQKFLTEKIDPLLNLAA